MVKIELQKWRSGTLADAGSPASLFNCDALAAANEFEGHLPLRLRCGDTSYLAYRRNASLVVPAISANDMAQLLGSQAELRSAAASFGVRALSMNSLNAPGAALDDLRLIVADSGGLRCEFVLDISSYTSGKISSNHRRNIKKAAKAGMEFRWVTGPEAVQAHLDMVNENLEGKGVGGLSNSVDYFCHLLRENAGALGQVFDGGDLVASTFFIENSACAYYHSSGTNAHGRKYGAAHYLVDRALDDMGERGMLQLNLGGATAAQGGLLRFKTGFRPETRLLASGRCALGGGFVSRLRALVRPTGARKEDRQTLQANVAAGSSEGFSLGLGTEQELVDDVIAHPELGQCLASYWRSGGACYRQLGPGDKLAGVLVVAPDRETKDEIRSVVSVGLTTNADEAVAGPALLPLLAQQVAEGPRMKFTTQAGAGDERLLARLAALGFE